MKRKIFGSFFITLFFSLFVLSQTQPVLNNVMIYSSVKYDSSKNIFRYTYKIRNGNTSQGDLWDFAIDISKNESEINYDTSGLEFINDLEHFYFTIDFPHLANSIVPVSYTKKPPFWEGTYGINKEAIFLCDGRNMVTPGTLSDEMEFVSKGIPGIRSFIANPFIADSLYPDLDDINNPDSLQELTDLFKNLFTFKSQTIGPKAPAILFNENDFIDTIKYYINQSHTLGWITNQATAEKYLIFFDSVHAMIERGSGRTARQTLDIIITNTILDSGSTLTSEAYALIRFNTEYFKNHLPTTTLNEPVENLWNLVSVPLELTDYSKTSVYPTAQSYVFGYKNGYIPKDTLTPGKGYWVKFGSAQTISYTGLAIDTLQAPIDTAWNIVGSVSHDIPVSMVSTDPSDLIATPFYKFTSSGYSPTDTLKAGSGYWVRMNESGTLLLGVSSSPDSQPPGEVPPPVGAPSTPVLKSPGNGVINQEPNPTFVWYSANGSETYRIQVAMDSNFTSIVIHQYAFTDTFRYVGSFSYNSTYYWRVNATNNSGTSAWSSVWKFTTQSPPSAPSTPTLASPFNGAVHVSITPSVSWNVSSGASTYRVQVATSSSFTTVVFDQNNITATSSEVGTLEYATTYYWRVNASNSAGTSSWSTVRHFTTESSEVPCSQYASLQSLDNFTVGEAGGKAQRLYFQNGKRALPRGFQNVSMPPEPPPGVFATRFQSGKFIERIRPNMPARRIPIMIRDAQRPVVLTWNIKNENKIQYWLIVPGRTERRIPLNGNGSRDITNERAGSLIIETQSVDPCEQQ